MRAISFLWLGAGVLCLLPPVVHADTLDDVRARGTLRWGADQEGGGPYVYPDPNDPHRATGFEVELLNLLAARLQVSAEFKQCEWVNLPDVLRAGGIDVIANGYELTPAHLATKIATVPYYIYDLRLIVRRDNPSITSWDDITRSSTDKKKIGVIGGSAAEAYLQKVYGDSAIVRPYNGFTDAMADLRNKNLDASVQDNPPVTFYQNRFPDLRVIGEPRSPGYYVLYLRKEDSRLRDQLNTSLLELVRGGQLQALYERYGLWNETQVKLGTAEAGNSVAEQSTEVRGWEVLWRNLPILIESAWMTVQLTFMAMPIAIVLGLAIALGRLYGPGPLRWPLAAHVEILRGTPVLLQLLTIYYVIPPALGIRIDPVVAAVVGLGLNYSAYESEIYRAGLLAIPVGQMEAALALGMTRRTALRRVIVPQAIRLVVPPVTNDFIALFKDTSICSVITIVELSKRFYILVNSTNAYLELALTTAVLYLLMSYPLSLVARRLERRSPGRSGQAGPRA